MRKRTVKSLGAGLALLAMMVPGAALSQAPTVRPTLASIRAQVAADCAAGRFSGLVVAARRGRVVYRQVCGFADAARRVALRPEARFKLFSLSKSFTATVIMRLAARGHIDLDRSILSYLPEAPEAWRGATVRHLLHHQSGIPDLTERLLQAYQRGGARTHARAMSLTLASPEARAATLTTSPGTEWRYSNFGYELLARIAERVEGRAFADILRREILVPAGMRTASVEGPAPGHGALASAPSPGLVPGFNGAPDGWIPATSYGFVQQGAGALHAGYRDLLAFDAALRAGRLLSPAMQARNVGEAVRASDTARYGYGWLIRSMDGCTYWQHSGGTNGYMSDFARVPESGITVIVLSNLGFADVSSLRRDLLQALLAPAGAPDACRRG